MVVNTLRDSLTDNICRMTDGGVVTVDGPREGMQKFEIM